MEILSRGNRTQDRDRNPFLVDYLGSPVSAKPLHYLGFGGRVGNDLWINELSSSMGKEGRAGAHHTTITVSVADGRPIDKRYPVTPQQQG